MGRRILIGAAVFNLLLVAGVVSQVRFDIPLRDLMTEYAPAPSRFITVRGLPVHYRDEGKGFPVVLIHGFASSLHTWDGWAGELKKKYRVIRMDLPGFGLTGPRTGGEYSTAAERDFLEDFLAALGVKKCHLAGNSMGGDIAWNYAASHPDKVRKLILIDSAGYPREKKFSDFHPMRIPLIAWIVRHITPRFIISGALKSAYGDPDKVTDDLIDRYYRLLLRDGNRGALAERMGHTPGLDNSLMIRRISAPVLILWGEKDRWIPLRHAYLFKKDIPGSLLKIYPGVGHVPMEETPLQTARDAEEFLK